MWRPRAPAGTRGRHSNSGGQPKEFGGAKTTLGAGFQPLPFAGGLDGRGTAPLDWRDVAECKLILKHLLVRAWLDQKPGLTLAGEVSGPRHWITLNEAAQLRSLGPQRERVRAMQTPHGTTPKKFYRTPIFESSAGILLGVVLGRGFSGRPPRRWSAAGAWGFIN